MLRKIAVALLSISLVGLSACQSRGPQYRNAKSFNEGLAPVQSSNGKWGYINQNNHMTIPAKFEDAQEFKSGRAAVKFNGKWGFINKQGDWL